MNVKAANAQVADAIETDRAAAKQVRRGMIEVLNEIIRSPTPHRLRHYADLCEQTVPVVRGMADQLEPCIALRDLIIGTTDE